MKKIILSVIAASLLLASCSTFGGNSAYHEEETQPPFQRLENVPEGKCVIYMYRLPAFYGAAAIWNVKVLEAGADSFPTSDKNVYAYLLQNGYVPIIVDAGVTYQMFGAGVFYFRGEPGTEVLLGAKGDKWGFECIAGSCEAYLTHGGFSRKKQTSLITTGEYLEEYSAVSQSERMAEISQTRLASALKPYIQKP